jgi:hypothetical protein
VPLSPEQTQRISTTVGKKVINPCPLCGVKDWGWGADLVLLQTQRVDPATASELGTLAGNIFGKPSTPPLETLPPSFYDSLKTLASLASKVEPPPTYPLLPVICNNCGNTVLLNVYFLGIADIWPAIAASSTGR